MLRNASKLNFSSDFACFIMVDDNFKYKKILDNFSVEQIFSAILFKVNAWMVFLAWIDVELDRCLQKTSLHGKSCPVCEFSRS